MKKETTEISTRFPSARTLSNSFESYHKCGITVFVMLMCITKTKHTQPSRFFSIHLVQETSVYGMLCQMNFSHVYVINNSRRDFFFRYDRLRMLIFASVICDPDHISLHCLLGFSLLRHVVLAAHF